jgi:hypothetical protein
MLPKDSKAICSLHDFWYKGKKVGIWMAQLKLNVDIRKKLTDVG